MTDSIEDRIYELKDLIKLKRSYITYIILTFIVWLATYIRTRNIPLLKDVTTGQYIPIELDTFAFRRYSLYILEHGSLMANDLMRYYPLGYDPRSEFGFLSAFHVYAYKFWHIFFSSLTFDLWFILYPLFCFIIMLIAFFFLTKILFNDDRIALLSTIFLAVSPPFLFRTISGFSDKESFALMGMTLSLLFYVYSYKEKNFKKSILFGMISGLFTSMTGVAWGGVVYLYIIIGLVVLIELLIGKLSDKEIYSYIAWFLTTIFGLFVLFDYRLPIKSFIFSLNTILIIVSFLLCIVYLMVKKYTSIPNKKIVNIIPLSIISLLITIGIFLFFAILKDPHYIYKMIVDVYTTLVSPEGAGRWGLTVAESKVTYVEEWIGFFSTDYFYLFIIAPVVLFYNWARNLKKFKYYLTVAFLIFILSFIFSKYSQNSILNGSSFFSRLLLFGGCLIMILTFLFVYFYGFYKDKDLYNSFVKLDMEVLLLIVWFLIVVQTAKGKVRLIMMLSPITSILIAFLMVFLYDFILNFDIKPFKILSRPVRFGSKAIEFLSRPIKIPLKGFKIIALTLLFSFLFSPFAPVVQAVPGLAKIPIINAEGILISFTKISLAQAYQLGPTVSQQWQLAMKWVREKTPKDAVFAHWWDYGYWVQGLGERATISDGGNSRGAINYFTGRYLMTGTNETETLEFLSANNVSYILMENADIGKYPAYSSIGSDVNYDRFSWINNFGLNSDKSKLGVAGIDYLLFEGNFPFDEDFEFKGVKFPRKGSAIIGIVIPIENKPSGVEIKQPKAYVATVTENKLYEVPLNCVFYNHNELIYNSPDGLNGCVIVLPDYISNTQVNPVGAVIYTSERVRKGNFAKYYLYGASSKNFQLVYSDDNVMPFVAYQGRIIGPIRIWKVHYPDDIKDNPLYRQTYLPDGDLYFANSTYQ